MSELTHGTVNEGFKAYPKGSIEQLTTNFQPWEFDCKGNDNHDTIICMELITKLQGLRNLLNRWVEHGFINKIDDSKEIGIKITSGHRCESHNRHIGGAKDSKHILGIAVDCKVTNLQNPRYDKLVMVAHGHLGFTGLGVYVNRMHLDVRPESECPYGFALWPENKGLK